MGMIEDILNALDRIPIWKRLSQLPGEVDSLNARVAELEEKLGGKWPADVCPFCGARAYRLERVDMHGQREIINAPSARRSEKLGGMISVALGERPGGAGANEQQSVGCGQFSICS